MPPGAIRLPKNLTMVFPPLHHVDEANAARICDLSTPRMRAMRTSRDPVERARGPRFVVIDNWRICYNVAVLEHWVAARAAALRATADHNEATATAAIAELDGKGGAS